MALNKSRSQDLTLHLDPTAKTVYANVDPKQVPSGAVRFSVNCENARERVNLLLALDEAFTLYVAPGSLYAEELGLTPAGRASAAKSADAPVAAPGKRRGRKPGRKPGGAA